MAQLQPYLVVAHGDVAYETNSITFTSSESGTFNDIITYPHLAGEDLVIKLNVTTQDESDCIGEGLLRLDPIRANYSGTVVTTVPLLYNNSKPGEVTLEVELLSEIFESRVKSYQPIHIKKNEKISKKIKYYNPDEYAKTLTVSTANLDLVIVKTPSFVIPPKNYQEIRLKFSSPQYGEQRCRIDIFNTKSAMVEESLLFKLRAI